MEKKTIRVDIGEEKTFDAQPYKPEPTDIEEVLNWLNKAWEQGATNIDWTARQDYDGYSDEIAAQPYLLREETDEELAAREKAAKEDKDRMLTEEYQKVLERAKQLREYFDKGI